MSSKADPRFRNLGIFISRLLDAKKAESLSLLHVGPWSSLADYLLIATALSSTHLRTLEEELVKEAKKSGPIFYRRAKPAGDHWRVIDFGGLIVHLMTEEARRFYALDKIYPEARHIHWQNGQKTGKA